MNTAVPIETGVRSIMTVVTSPRYKWRHYGPGLKARGSKYSKGPSGPTIEKLKADSLLPVLDLGLKLAVAKLQKQEEEKEPKAVEMAMLYLGPDHLVMA